MTFGKIPLSLLFDIKTMKNKTCKKCKASFVPEKNEEYCKECIIISLKRRSKKHGNRNEKS